MTTEEKQVLRQKIIAMMKQVRKDIEQLEELTQPISPDNAIGRVSRMDAINNKSVNEANLRRSKVKMGRLKTALSKIDEPNFGRCSSCGRSIQPARLMLMPESSRCVRCAR